MTRGTFLSFIMGTGLVRRSKYLELGERACKVRMLLIVPRSLETTCGEARRANVEREPPHSFDTTFAMRVTFQHMLTEFSRVASAFGQRSSS